MTLHGCSYDEAVELTGHGRYNYLLLGTCSLIASAVAIDMFGFSIIAAAATCDLDLTMTTTGLLNSTPLAGIVIFAFPWGYLADRRGRRRALLLSTTGGFIFSTLCSIAPNWQTMFVLKLAGCSFSTASYTLTMTYLGEGTGSVRRRRYLFILNSANLAAELIFYALAYFILPLDFLIPIPWLGITLRPWRVYTLVLAAPLGVGALLLLMLYESPKLLATRGKTEKALDVLRKIYKINGGKGEYTVKNLSVETKSTEALTDSFWATLVKQTVPIFKPPLLWRTIQLYHLIAICSATNNVYLLWYPMIVNLFFNSFSGAGSDLNPSFCERVVANITVDDQAKDYICDDTISPNTMYAGMMLGLTFATMNLAASAVASYRRLVLIAVYLIAGVSLIIVDHLKEPVMNMVAFTMVQITAIGIGSVASYFVDLYPTAYRGMVTSMSMMFMRLISLAGVNVVGLLIATRCRLAFYCSAIYVASGIVVALFLPPDTRQYK